MTWHGDLTAHGSLFVLDFVVHPDLLLERGRSAGITNSYVLEITAWCAELNEQVNRVAEREGVDLQLMGGNAASLRLDASAQRGSRDNDYLTTATGAEVQRLMDGMAAHFDALPAPLLRPKNSTRRESGHCRWSPTS